MGTFVGTLSENTRISVIIGSAEREKAYPAKALSVADCSVRVVLGNTSRKLLCVLLLTEGLQVRVLPEEPKRINRRLSLGSWIHASAQADDSASV